MKLPTTALVASMCILFYVPAHAADLLDPHKVPPEKTFMENHPVIKQALLLPARVIDVPVGFLVGGTIAFVSAELSEARYTHPAIAIVQRMPLNAAWYYWSGAYEGWCKPFSVYSFGLQLDPDNSM